MTKHPDLHRDDSSMRRRKPYAKPEIRQVALRAEEAVLGNCKSGGGAGPGNPCTKNGGCVNPGS